MLEDDKANVFVKATDCKIVLTGMEGDNVILLQVAVSVRIDNFRLEEKQVVSDVFLADYEIETEQDCCKYNVMDKTYNLFDKIVGNATVGDDMVAVSKVICTSLSRNIIVNTYYDEGKIVVEGVLAVNLVYLNIEGNTQSILIELPYSLQFDEVMECTNKLLCAEAIVDNLYAKVKRDREFEVTANISITVTADSPIECKTIKAVTVTDIKKCNSYSIVIYNCKEGDELWDVAKAIGASMEQIVAQNNDLQGDLAGRKIVYYRQINC